MLEQVLDGLHSVILSATMPCFVLQPVHRIQQIVVNLKLKMIFCPCCLEEPVRGRKLLHCVESLCRAFSAHPAPSSETLPLLQLRLSQLRLLWTRLLVLWGRLLRTRKILSSQVLTIRILMVSRWVIWPWSFVLFIVVVDLLQAFLGTCVDELRTEFRSNG